MNLLNVLAGGSEGGVRNDYPDDASMSTSVSFWGRGIHVRIYTYI